MNIIIIEDEAPAKQRLTRLIKEQLPHANIIASADSIESAVAAFNSTPNANLAFMDIELADGQSFEIFKQTTVNCPVIFTTAYDEFALKAFRVNAIDYLLKPIDANELKSALDKYTKSTTLMQTPIDIGAQVMTLINNIKQEPIAYKSRFLIKTGNKMISVPVNEIAVFTSVDKIVYAHTTKQQKYLIDHSLDELCRMLEPKLFFQLNRQYIAHIDAIKSIHTYFNGKLKIDLNIAFAEEIIVSREKASAFKFWLNS